MTISSGIIWKTKHCIATSDFPRMHRMSLLDGNVFFSLALLFLFQVTLFKHAEQKNFLLANICKPIQGAIRKLRFRQQLRYLFKRASANFAISIPQLS